MDRLLNELTGEEYKKHAWKGGMTVGTSDNLSEGYSVCENCGAEEDEDNVNEECLAEAD